MPAELPRRETPGGRGAHARIVRAALVLFRQRGINATGVAELAAAAQVSKRTLYQHFPSKDDVIIAYLQAFEDDPASGPRARWRGPTSRPGHACWSCSAALGEQGRPLRGCPFINAAVELADPAHPAYRLAAAHKRRFAERLTGLARERGPGRPSRWAAGWPLLYDGAAAQTVTLRQPRAGRGGVRPGRRRCCDEAID